MIIPYYLIGRSTSGSWNNPISGNWRWFVTCIVHGCVWEHLNESKSGNNSLATSMSGELSI